METVTDKETVKGLLESPTFVRDRMWTPLLDLPGFLYDVLGVNLNLLNKTGTGTLIPGAANGATT
jgi:hypothetical protein